jgi:hypothetical protein
MCKKTQNITLHGVLERFSCGRKPYDCVATFASPYRPGHLPPYPNWISEGVAMRRGNSDNYTQYLSPKGLRSFLQRVR